MCGRQASKDAMSNSHKIPNTMILLVFVSSLLERRLVFERRYSHIHNTLVKRGLDSDNTYIPREPHWSQKPAFLRSPKSSAYDTVSLQSSKLNSTHDISKHLQPSLRKAHTISIPFVLPNTT